MKIDLAQQSIDQILGVPQEHIILALEFVTNDRFIGHGSADWWTIHADTMDQFFEDTNDGESCDWDWSEVIPYWDADDIELALEDWEDFGSPTRHQQDQIYAELEDQE